MPNTILWVPVIFLLSALCLYTLAHSIHLWDKDMQDDFLKFPTSLEDIRVLSGYLIGIKERHFPYVLLLFCSAYTFKQTFAIPGSFLMNLLGGALFGPYMGFILCCLLSAIGATSCFLLSRTFGRAYVVKYFPDRVGFFQKKIDENKDSLFFFLLFLRMFPMSPNWVINVVCPLVGVPVHYFFVSVFIGLMPYNFICTQTGATLSQISSVNEIFTSETMLKLMLMALVALVPGLIIKRFHTSAH